MKREDVYKLIDSERDYQNSLGASRTDGSKKTVGDYLTMMNAYLQKAVEDWTFNPGCEKALDEIRKIAAITVRCMEEHETKPRK